MIYQRSCNQKKARMAVLISDKIDLMTQNMTIDKKENFIMIRVNTHQRAIIIIYETQYKII